MIFTFKMHFDEICRACLKEGSMRSIFSTETKVGGLKMSCFEMLTASASVTAAEGDGLPQQICSQCFKKLTTAYKFRIQCESSFAMLLEYSANKIKVDDIKSESSDVLPSDNLNNYNDIPKVCKDLPKVELKVEDHLQNDTVHLKGEVVTDDTQTDNGFQNEVCSIPSVEDYASPEDWHEEPLNIVDTEKINKPKKLRSKQAKELKKSRRSPSSSSKALKCTLCPKTFKWMYMLVAHHDSHIGIKRYFCEICQKSYRVEKDHKNMHRRGFKFKCEICTKCFNTKAKLNIHIDTHSTDRQKIICGLDGCKKTFLSTNGLDRHRVAHNGSKDFICHLCSKSFRDKYQLEVHIRTHTNERPHPCEFCNKMFITTSARNSHERWHTNTKNYHCQYCEKSFVCSSGLKRHLLCHTKEQLQKCRFCGKKFARDDNKKRHEMAMHGFTEEATRAD